MSKIEWTEKTWNPIIGCRRVSEGCRNCYAEVQAVSVVRRLTEMERRTGSKKARETGDAYWSVLRHDEHDQVLPRWSGNVQFLSDRLLDPLRWRKPSMIFVNSMSDLFHEEVSNETIAAIFGVMASAPQHTFQVLTKRPERMLEWFAWADKAAEETKTAIYQSVWNSITSARAVAIMAAIRHDNDAADFQRKWCGDAVGPWPLPNVWLGVSVENQKAADERIPLLLRTPAAVRWVSAEPLLESVELRRLGGDAEFGDAVHYDALTGVSSWAPNDRGARLDWVVVGGESGIGARPCDPRWIRSIVYDCQSTGVPVFVKQLGGERDKRGDIYRFPEPLRVRQYPTTTAGR